MYSPLALCRVALFAILASGMARASDRSEPDPARPPAPRFAIDARVEPRAASSRFALQGVVLSDPGSTQAGPRFTLVGGQTKGGVACAGVDGIFRNGFEN